MKSLRIWFVASMVWALAGLALVACSDKKSSSNSCPTGMISYNGICTYDYNNGGSGSGLPPTGAGIPYNPNPNGTVQNTDNFRDFNYRLFNMYYVCSYNYPWNCKDAQIKVQAINSTRYNIYITSPSLSGRSVVLTADKFTYDGQSQVIFQIYYGNPYPYIIAELVMNSGLDAAQTYYSFNYLRNANSTSTTPIITGVMTKGLDY